MTEQIARALKLSMGLMAFGQDKVVNGRQESTGKYNLKVVRQYLDSPAGEKAVRDKVREMCETVEYEYVRSRKIHRVWPFLGWEKDSVPFKANTESEAWTAALLWLDSQAEKGVE